MKILEQKFVVIKGFENYIIYENGEIINTKFNRSINHCDNGRGYRIVGLSNNGKVKLKTMHRLLAEAFIPNPNNYPQINHIDGIKDNNSLDNLEWCTNQQNNQHAWAIGLKKTSEKQKESVSRIVLDTETGIYYNSIAEAAFAKSMNYNILGNMLCGRSINKTTLIYPTKTIKRKSPTKKDSLFQQVTR